MKAIILAGGKGTRLKPFTTVIPKPLVPVGDKAILEILIEKLQGFGITDIVLCVNHMASLIMAYFGDGSKLGVKIKYSQGDKFLGTVAPIKLIKDLPENFLVMNGDILTDLNVLDLYNYHMQNKSLLTVATYRRKIQIDFGVIDVNEEKNIAIGFHEKPTHESNVSMGVYVFNRELLSYVPDNLRFGFDDLMYKLLYEEKIVKIYPFCGYWLDIGRSSDYDKANEDIDIIIGRK